MDILKKKQNLFPLFGIRQTNIRKGLTFNIIYIKAKSTHLSPNFIPTLSSVLILFFFFVVNVVSNVLNFSQFCT